MVDMQLYGDSLLYRDYTEQEQKKTEKELRHKLETMRELSQIRFLSWTKLNSSPDYNLDIVYALSLE